MYKLKYKTKFSAAHQLENAYSDECNNYKHGHNFLTFITIEVDKLYKNMVIDFKMIKEIVNELDHRDLNEILDFEPTAENLSKYLQQRIKNKVIEIDKSRSIKVEVEVQETEGSSISYYEL